MVVMDENSYLTVIGSRGWRYTLYANFPKDKIQKVAIRERAPDFKLVDLNHEKHRLSDYEEDRGIPLDFFGLRFLKYSEKDSPILIINTSNLKMKVFKY